jgi:FKBP-type peptidyl-prolyl cis-trans isomerase 2
MEKTKKNEFVELLYTGYSQGKIFDSNIEEDLKKIDEKAKPIKTIVIIGQGMVVSGLDKALEDKEIEKEYEITLKPKESFGERRKELVRMIPLKIFIEKQVMPRPGMVLALDNNLIKVIAVSGARVTADFNSPLAGKDVTYKFTIKRKVEDEKEKVNTLFETTLRFLPEYEIRDKIIVKGPKVFETIVKALNEKFKEFIGKELGFELKEEKPKENEAIGAKEHAHEHSHEGHEHEHSVHEHNHEHNHEHEHEHSHEHEHNHEH